MRSLIVVGLLGLGLIYGFKNIVKGVEVKGGNITIQVEGAGFNGELSNQ